MIDGKIRPPSMAATMNMALTVVEKGFARFEATADKSHLNPMGGVHGGFAATILDSATGCAVHSVLDVGESYGTIDLNVKMMRPVPIGVKLYGDGEIINRSRTLAVSQAKLVDGDGKIYAHATCTCKIISLQRAKI
ncbi:MAG: PaaI family thioesterase [Psychrobium sp.]|nr:PaaI family thioesterase [Psychrobium sp.]